MVWDGSRRVSAHYVGCCANIRDTLCGGGTLSKELELLRQAELDPAEWEVATVETGTWDAFSAETGVIPMSRERATFRRKAPADFGPAQVAIQAAIEDLANHSPVVRRAGVRRKATKDEPVLFEIAIMDPHIGMLAWKKETGDVDYDLNIAVNDYENTVQELVGLAESYPMDRILYVLGNDLVHIDMVVNKVGTTTHGTPQDFDTRLPKIFTAARRAAVAGIDRAASLAPVDVLVVPGNHDETTAFRLGEVLSAWYRNDDRVNIINEPRLRHYYTYGKNIIGFAHGKEYGRKRDSLPLIMATEAPEEWGAASYREIHCGHFHSVSEREFMAPVGLVDEYRGVRVRVLPGLTPADAWHTEQGYHHHRAATGLVFKKEGGLLAIHEVMP